jgi:hypothetical protein
VFWNPLPHSARLSRSAGITIWGYRPYPNLANLVMSLFIAKPEASSKEDLVSAFLKDRHVIWMR